MVSETACTGTGVPISAVVYFFLSKYVLKRFTDSFKGNVGETSERRGEAHMGFSERIIPLTELRCTLYM